MQFQPANKDWLSADYNPIVSSSSRVFRIYLLAQGRLVGQVAAEASPAAVMELSFADQALCTHYLLKMSQHLPPAVYDVPPDIDERVASLKLRALGVQLDALNEDQRTYQRSWKIGTV
jgi:adenosylhomocysteinase